MDHVNCPSYSDLLPFPTSKTCRSHFPSEIWQSATNYIVQYLDTTISPISLVPRQIHTFQPFPTQSNCCQRYHPPLFTIPTVYPPQSIDTARLHHHSILVIITSIRIHHYHAFHLNNHSPNYLCHPHIRISSPTPTFPGQRPTRDADAHHRSYGRSSLGPHL